MNTIDKVTQPFSWLMASLLMVLVAGCGGGSDAASGTTDTTAPTVNSTVPTNTSIGLALNSSISATFNEAMTSATLTNGSFTVVQGQTSVPGTTSYVNNIATFKPTNNLTGSTAYTASISTGAHDLAGNAMAVTKTWNFTSGAAADAIAPTVSSTSPADSSTGAVLNTNVAATFSEAMNPATLTATTYTLKQGATSVPGTVSYLGSSATFNPTSNLAASTLYTATITTGATDQAGNALASNFVWTFTIGTAAAIGPKPVVLGTAGNFVVLAKTAISTTGATLITGDIGVSPIAATAITGFSDTMDVSNTFSTSTLVVGKIYAADYTDPTPAFLTTAISNMEGAYTDAAGRLLPDYTELGAGDISAMTLVPGLYKWGTGVSIDNTGVTLNGGANDVWIFQIAQGLTVANNAIVTLTGGAQPKNVFWQVGGQTTLGTTSDFKGVILCQTAIVLNTGATLHGRALAQTAVTLDANPVTQP
ncbi:MAG: ice-binding family protein [Gallionella sp.]